MYAVTDADRKAAEELRVLLADLSGFWFMPGDTGPICAALARHRVQSEAAKPAAIMSAEQALVTVERLHTVSRPIQAVRTSRFQPARSPETGHRIPVAEVEGLVA